MHCPMIGVGPGEGRPRVRSVLWASVSAGRLRARRRVRGGGRGCDAPSPAAGAPYDFCGAYGHRAHEDHAYGQLLGQEYSFSFLRTMMWQAPTPKGQKAVPRASQGRRPGSSLPAGSLYPHPVVGLTQA